MEETINFLDHLNYETWVAFKFSISSRKHLLTYIEALNEAHTARFHLEQKYNRLQFQFRSLQVEMEEKESDFLNKHDEEKFHNDVLRLQLDLAQSESAEHRDTIKSITKKLEERDAAFTNMVRNAEAELAEKGVEAMILASRIAEKDSIIDQFEQTCNILKTNLKKSHEDHDHETAGLKATISSQSEVILGLLKDIKPLETEEAAAITEQKAAAMELQTLQIAFEESQVSIHKLSQENQSLKNDVEALINMNIESKAIQGGVIEENKRLTDQAAILNRELDLVREVLMDRLKDLKPDLSNLSTALNERLRSKKNPRRRC